MKAPPIQANCFSPASSLRPTQAPGHVVSDTRSVAAQARRAHGPAAQRTARRSRNYEPQRLAEPTTHETSHAADDDSSNGDDGCRAGAIRERQSPQARQRVVECVVRDRADTIRVAEEEAPSAGANGDSTTSSATTGEEGHAQISATVVRDAADVHGVETHVGRLDNVDLHGDQTHDTDTYACQQRRRDDGPSHIQHSP